jgi:hypothetical protein
MPENGTIKIIMINIFEPTQCVNFAKLISNYVTFLTINGMNFILNQDGGEKNDGSN